MVVFSKVFLAGFFFPFKKGFAIFGVFGDFFGVFSNFDVFAINQLFCNDQRHLEWVVLILGEMDDLLILFNRNRTNLIAASSGILPSYGLDSYLNGIKTKLQIIMVINARIVLITQNDGH